MRSKPFLALLGICAVIAGFAGNAAAQRPTTPPIMPGNSGTHRKPWDGLRGRMGGMMHGAGQIVGNKNTKVYHLAGDKGNMPAEKNRVYFRSEREAMAAGYRAARQSHGPKTGNMGRPGGPHRMGGMGSMHPMPGGTRPMPGMRPMPGGTHNPLPK